MNEANDEGVAYVYRDDPFFHEIYAKWIASSPPESIDDARVLARAVVSLQTEIERQGIEAIEYQARIRTLENQVDDLMDAVKRLTNHNGST